MQSLVSYLNGEAVTNLDEIKQELEAELNRNAAKAQANRDLYEAARAIALDALKLVPNGCTAAELYAETEQELPDGFTKSKLQYALTHYWNDAVTAEKTKNGNVYRLA